MLHAELPPVVVRYIVVVSLNSVEERVDLARSHPCAA